MTAPSSDEQRARAIRDSNARPLPKRFYTAVDVANAADASFLIHLDGRQVRTPLRHPLVLGGRRLAEAIANEWRAQQTTIDPATMPLTTLATTAIDVVAPARDAILDEITRYAGSDLLCYRADDTPALADIQARTWDPLLAWAKSERGAAFVLASGLMPVTQPAGAAERLTAPLRDYSNLHLAAVHVLTTLTGSAILACAVAARRIDLPEAWSVAHVDEDWQATRWGEDADAARRRARRLREAEAAAFALAS